MTPVHFRPAAAADLDEAYRWYEGERRGLGDEFLQAARSLLLRISEQPRGFPLVYRDKRRAVFRRFPYSFFFRIVGEQVFILACMHGKRHPKAWRSR